MPLPRFTSGQVGKLTFAHLNEAFDRIENVDPELRASASPILGRVILARITGQSGSGASIKGSFQEVAVDNPTATSLSYSVVEGGITSATSAGTYGAPIVFPVSAIGTVVPILAHVAVNGALYFRECSAAAASASVRVGRVKTATTITANAKWLYTLTDIAVSNMATAQYVATGAADFTALNGCEEAVDVAAQRNIGVGTIHPVGSTATRQAIKVDTVVTCIPTAGGFVFSIPNGYSFVCS
jgi:hypothetical protein